MTRGRMWRLFVVLGVLMASASFAQAQARAGSDVSGKVVDESGAAMPGANVQLTGPGLNRFHTSGPEGQFTFAGVPAGTYKLSVGLTGFSTETVESIQVSGTAPLQVPPVTLKIALRGEEVVVTASK